MSSLPLAGDAGSTGATPADRAGARQARLAASVAGLRRRSTGGVELERVLLIAGSVLLPSGLIVILLGWFGASHTSYSFEQTPYLISGGVLGAAMTVAGGFLYFGYWLTRLVHESRRQRIELSELLTRLDNRMATLEAVATGTLPGAGRPGGHAGTAESGSPSTGASLLPAGVGGGTPADGDGRGLVATQTGTLVHRPDCALVAGRPGLRPVDPAETGLKACKVCQPFGAGEAPSAGRSPAAGATAGSAGTPPSRPLRAAPGPAAAPHAPTRTRRR